MPVDLECLATPLPDGHRPRVAVIGAGPAGLMAAVVLLAGGVTVDIFDAMPSAARKFLMAGKGGMNLTHSEPFDAFVGRYAEQRDRLAPLIEAFPATAIREWVHGLGIDTFVGTSGRVFPSDMKAAPMLRAWLHRLRRDGATLHMRHKWDGVIERSKGGERDKPAAGGIEIGFTAPGGRVTFNADAVVLAVGGASWPRLGSDASWVSALRAANVPVTDFKPANCGFDTAWTPLFKTRYAGQALKNVALAVFPDAPG